MRKIIIATTLFISVISSAQAVEADFQAKILNSLSTYNPDPEEIKVIGKMSFTDAEYLVNRASTGEPINVFFKVIEGDTNAEDPNVVYEQVTNLTFADGQTTIINGTQVTGRVMAEYDPSVITFSVRFAMKRRQEGSIGTNNRDVYTVIGSVQSGSDTVFGGESSSAVDFGLVGSGEPGGSDGEPNG